MLVARVNAICYSFDGVLSLRGMPREQTSIFPWNGECSSYRSCHRARGSFDPIATSDVHLLCTIAECAQYYIFFVSLRAERDKTRRLP